jgi:leucyl/phenylalanyl-tRNA---protein transferase
MAVEGDEIVWFDPDPRAIIPLDALHIPRSLQRVVRKGRYTVTVNQAFAEVIWACAAEAPGREETWISPAIIAAYNELHRLGFAHSVECWQNGRLAGGLYGVALKGLFAGESMFSRERDSSKVALVHLVQRLRAGGFQLLDVQFQTPHLARFGAIEIARSEYKRRLARALKAAADFWTDGLPNGGATIR